MTNEIKEYFGLYQKRGDPLPPPSEIVRFEEVQRKIEGPFPNGFVGVWLTLRQIEPTKDWPAGTLVVMNVSAEWLKTLMRRGYQTISEHSRIILPEEAEKFLAPAEERGSRHIKAKFGDGPFLFGTRDFALDFLEKRRQGSQ